MKAREKDKEKTRSQHQILFSRATAGHVASGGTRRASVGKVRISLFSQIIVFLPSVHWEFSPGFHEYEYPNSS